jgi:hypothetical protein
MNLNNYLSQPVEIAPKISPKLVDVAVTKASTEEKPYTRKDGSQGTFRYIQLSYTNKYDNGMEREVEDKRITRNNSSMTRGELDILGNKEVEELPEGFVTALKEVRIDLSLIPADKCFSFQEWTEKQTREDGGYNAIAAALENAMGK